MKHAALFDLRVAHSFYTDGRCPDFAIEPSAETARLLRNHRCLMRSMPDGVRIVTALDSADKPLLPLPPGALLRFHLALSNDDFALFTDLTDMNAKVLEVAGREERAPLFTSAGMNAGAAGDLDLACGSVACAPGVFADVEICLDGHVGLGEQAPVFRVALQARQWRWVYYCVTNLQPNGAELTIADKASAAAGEVLTFGAGEQPGPSDPIAAQIASRYPAMRCVRIMSDQAVACREQPRRDLELCRDNVHLSGPLPNPSVRHVSRLDAAQDVLFEIVKYRADPF